MDFQLIIIYTFLFIFGLCVGSFLNALIWRLYKEEKISSGRSYCPKCTKQIKDRDLIPVFSFILLKGKCRNCQQKISWQYPLVELLVGFLFVITFFTASTSLNLYETVGMVSLFLYLFFATTMVLVFVFDLKYYLILDKVTFPSALLILVLNLFLKKDLADMFLGVIVGGGFFWLQYQMPTWGRYIFKDKYPIFQKEWIGGGDVKLGIVIGLMLGFKLTLLTLFLSYVFGSIIGVLLISLSKKKMDSQVPFGTFLSASAIVSLLYGNMIIDWYIGLM